jgi:hypothetical protein
LEIFATDIELVRRLSADGHMPTLTSFMNTGLPRMYHYFSYGIVSTFPASDLISSFLEQLHYQMPLAANEILWARRFQPFALLGQFIPRPWRK